MNASIQAPSALLSVMEGIGGGNFTFSHHIISLARRGFGIGKHKEADASGRKLRGWSVYGPAFDFGDTAVGGKPQRVAVQKNSSSQKTSGVGERCRSVIAGR